MGKIPLGKVRSAYALKRGKRLHDLRPMRLGKGRQLTGGTHQHHIKHGIAKRRAVNLGDIRDAAGKLAL